MTGSEQTGNRILGTLRRPDQPEQIIEVPLTAERNQTILAWEERGMDIDHLAGYGAGIQVHIEDLAARLAGREGCDAAARWSELFPAYQGLVGSSD